VGCGAAGGPDELLGYDKLGLSKEGRVTWWMMFIVGWIGLVAVTEWDMCVCVRGRDGT
jgi:hypothetical protein